MTRAPEPSQVGCGTSPDTVSEEEIGPVESKFIQEHIKRLQGQRSQLINANGEIKRMLTQNEQSILANQGAIAALEYVLNPPEEKTDV